MSKIKKLFVLILVLLPVLLVADEGYDPLIQITHQIAKPNMLLVIDCSGSMAWDMTGNNVGVDALGGLPSWTSLNRPTSKSTDNPCKGNYRFYTTLKANLPSRMAILKNALGNSVTINDWDYRNQPESLWQNIATNTGWTYWKLDGDGQPMWYYCSTSTTGPSTRPFTVNSSIAGYQAKPPKDLIGQTKNQVNWAVVIFSQSYASCASGSTPGKATVKTIFSDSDDVTVIENLFKTGAGGLPASGGTPTRAGMDFAKTYMINSILGQQIKDFNNKTFSPSLDTKFFNCNRTYGVVLVTDGLSNNCNKGSSNDKNWINPCCADSNIWPCSTYPQYDCDPGSSGYDCDRRNNVNRAFTNFPPNEINNLYLATFTHNGKTYRPGIKTWAIGISKFVNPCEINFDAYMGMTDASSTAGDAGFDTSKDLGRQPKRNTYTEGQNDPFPGKVHYTTLQENEENDSNYNRNDPRTGNNYGFFANNADDLANAFAAIVAGVATGDYTTSSPVSTASATVANDTDVFLTSADFPGWRGHLYCYKSPQTDTEDAQLNYDAGERLLAQSNSTRRIYTWDSSKQLTEVNQDNLSTLKSIASAFTAGFDSNKLTPQVIDFIRGNNGSGTARAWKLGPIINSTPAIIGPPAKFKNSNIEGRAEFETTYSSRKQLIYIGSDDGMLHCFVLSNEEETIGLQPGQELFAIMPPDQLAKQVNLYDTFLSTGMATGQPKQPKDHIYGVANSPRFGDIYLGSGVWKTYLFLTEGPGGQLVAAIDVTDPFGNITADPSQPPCSIVWYHTPQTCPELKFTWSVPAFAMKNSSAMLGIMGTGYDYTAGTTSPYLLSIDPIDGSLIKRTLTGQSGSYVKNQAFAHSGIFQTTVGSYADDNFADLGIQADLNGQIWFYKVSDDSISTGINVGSKQPIYYSPAISGYRVGENTYDIYVFASGTPYEKDEDITGSNVGNNNGFIPSIWIGVKKNWGPDNASMNLTQKNLKDLTWEDASTNPPQTYTMGKKTQVTSSPLMIVPKNEGGGVIIGPGGYGPTAIFAVYDPDTADCAGTSYVVTLKISVDATGTVSVSHSGYSAGSGASSGFAVIGKGVVVAKSGIGEGQRATIKKVKGVTLSDQGGVPTPTIWRELQ